MVIGAGLGGLVAGAHLAREGCKVLVLEGGGHPGGTAYTFRVGDFRFPMGPLGFSSPATVREIWEGLCGEKLEVQRVAYRLRAFGLDLEVSAPLDLLGERLKAAFPGESKGIEGFFAGVRELAAALRKTGDGSSLDLARRGSSTSAREFLGELVKDGRLRRILGSQGCREPFSSMALLAAMWDLLCEQGIHYPAGGFDRMSDSLAASLGSSSPGGEILLGKRVAGIAVEGGKAVGVELEDGGNMQAGTVICNADFRRTFLELLPAPEVPAPWREAVASAPLSSSAFQVAVGLNASRADLSVFKDAGRVLFCPQEQEKVGKGLNGSCRASRLSASEMELCLLSRDDPGLAPYGGAVLIIRTSAAWEDFRSYRLGRFRRSPDYRGHKMEMAQALLSTAAQLIPGLEEAVVCLDAATPLTFADRANRSEGAVAGWSWEFREGLEGWRELVRTPVAGLYMCGHQAYSSMLRGGVPSAMLSGREAALAALRGDPPLAEPPFPAGGRDAAATPPP